jgi:hypothetical protein
VRGDHGRMAPSSDNATWLAVGLCAGSGDGLGGLCTRKHEWATHREIKVGRRAGRCCAGAGLRSRGENMPMWDEPRDLAQGQYSGIESFIIFKTLYKFAN